jgi:group I intron endonuclease
MYGIIYRVTGPTGKVYIGQTTNTLNRRKGQHAYRTKKGDNRETFQAALLDEGFSAFTWEQVDTANSKEELDTKEKHWIAYFDSTNTEKGYNSTAGGVSYTPSPEHRQKIRVALQGRKHSAELRRKNSESHKGLKSTPETCLKMSLAHKGKKRKPLSPETKRKVSEGLKRFYQSQQGIVDRKKRSARLKGRTVSEETRCKMSDAQKHRHNRQCDY